MAHKCNYRLFTEKCITLELSLDSSINTFASFSTTGIIAFMNLGVRLQLRATVAQSLTEAGRWKILRPIPLFSQINEDFIDYNQAF